MSYRVVVADLGDERDLRSVVEMVDGYAQDPMGNGRRLGAQVKRDLGVALHEHPTSLVLLALHDERPVGVAVCFFGFSTFAARRLLNIHDLYVAAEHRGAGLGKQLLSAAEQQAKARDCCKLTLEVMDKNLNALGLYKAVGFQQAVYQEEAGAGLFLVKAM